MSWLLNASQKQQVTATIWRTAYEKAPGFGIGSLNHGYAPVSAEVAADPSVGADGHQVELYRQAMETVPRHLLRPDGLTVEISCGLGKGLDYVRRAYGLTRVLGIEPATPGAAHAAATYGLPVARAVATAWPVRRATARLVLSIGASTAYFNTTFMNEATLCTADNGVLVLADHRHEPLAAARSLHEAAFEQHGFAVEDFRDITANVVDACVADTPRRESILSHVPWPVRGMARNFLATEGSDRLKDFREGRRCYFIIVGRRRPR